MELSKTKEIWEYKYLITCPNIGNQGYDSLQECEAYIAEYTQWGHTNFRIWNQETKSTIDLIAEEAALGKKFDSYKKRWSLLLTGIVELIVDVLEFGAKKYAPDNWKHVKGARTRYYDAAQRHIEAWWNEEMQDTETTLPHLAHAICCLMFLLWLDENNEKP